MDIMTETNDSLKIIVRAEKTGKRDFRVHKVMLIGPDKEVWDSSHLIDKACMGDDIRDFLIDTDVHDYVLDQLDVPTPRRCCGGGCH